MKRNLQILWALVALCCLSAVVVAVSDESTVIQITKTGTNIYQVGITNGTNTGYYELYYSPVLADPAYPFTLIQIGAQGQTNFNVTNLVNPNGFFFVGNGNDWDHDGIPNYQDANPLSTNFGSIQILIDSPTNGMVFQ